MDEKQSSHRKKSRTTDNVFILRSVYEKYCLKDNKKLYACFIDFRKAFDCIWHEGLFLKLQKMGIRGNFYQVIKSMYKNATAAVKFNSSELSQPFPILRGVKQGDILSPLLFNLFVNDILPLLQCPESSPPSLIDKPVGGLLYADDLVVLSTTHEGLQTSLKKLSAYCKEWKLEINRTKSKTMCLSKEGRSINEDFFIGEDKLENVSSYTYLGLEITDTFSFTCAQKSLTDKAMRALFKLKGLLHGSGLQPSASLRLFDQLIKPICLYGSEIWGAEFCNSSELPKILKNMEKLICEKINISMCRFTLGLHKKSQISAIRGELGRYPLGIDIIANLMKYRDALKKKDKGSILYKALLSCEKSSNKRINNKLWDQKCCLIQQHIEDTSFNLDFSKRKCVKTIFESHYNTYWRQKINLEKKMRTYCLFKERFVPEDYLQIHNEAHRKALTRLRVSAHSLAIEKGRYTTPTTPVEDRICAHCPGNIIEDEFHFMMKCEKYEMTRKAMFTHIESICPNFRTLGDTERFTYMLSAGISLVPSVAKFVFESMC